MITAQHSTPSLVQPDRGLQARDVRIKDLGRCTLASPLADRLGQSALHYVGEADKVLFDDRLSNLGTNRRLISEMPAFELAGPRNRIYFNPGRTRCAVVTCGGLCPGLNNVVRGLVQELRHGYGIRDVLGYRFGYEGITRSRQHAPTCLDDAAIADIHLLGGTVLGTSRGNQDPGEMVDQLLADQVDVLFVIGGDGTMRGAMALAAEIERRAVRIAVVGVPKTIDNDIEFIDRSFGFETAFTAGVDAIRSAHTEARGMRGGIGLVKLMGRHSGFIACHSAMASAAVSAVLIPEVTVQLGGARGLLTFLERTLERQGHAVVVVAEGAGSQLCPPSDDVDASGNARLPDIGAVLRSAIATHFRALARPINLKYIDPSYHIRSVPASPADSVYCWHLARHAVHAAMAGNTELIVGRWHGRFVHVPMALATRSRKQVDPSGDLWISVIESTGQPVTFS